MIQDEKYQKQQKLISEILRCSSPTEMLIRRRKSVSNSGVATPTSLKDSSEVFP